MLVLVLVLVLVRVLALLLVLVLVLVLVRIRMLHESVSAAPGLVLPPETNGTSLQHHLHIPVRCCCGHTGRQGCWVVFVSRHSHQKLSMSV